MDELIHAAYFKTDIIKQGPHYHDCHQILFIKRGVAELELDNQKSIARSGDIVIFSRNGQHSVNIISDFYERYVIRINPYMNFNTKEYSLFFTRQMISKNIFSIDDNDKAADFHNIFDTIVKEKSISDKFSRDMQELLIKQLLIMICRLDPERLLPFENDNFEIIFDLQKKLKNNCQEQYSLSDLANAYHISVSSLSHQFKKITGFSVFEYLFSCRLALAKHMLTKTDLGIGEIVEKTGFSDNSNFSRSFKESVGMTPSQFRKQYR